MTLRLYMQELTGQRRKRIETVEGEAGTNKNNFITIEKK
jgi:hypothetical protein